MKCPRCGTVLTANTMDRCPRCAPPPRGMWQMSVQVFWEIVAMLAWDIVFWFILIGCVVAIVTGIVGLLVR